MRVRLQSLLAGYLNTLEDGAPEKLVHELIGLNLRVGNIDMLADTLERHSASLSEDSVAEYLKAGLALDSTNLRLRVFAEHHLGWNMQEVDRQIGEQSGLEVSSDEHIAFENDSATLSSEREALWRSSVSASISILPTRRFKPINS